MSSVQIKEVLPKQGQLYEEDLPTMILCKPKLMPLKSVTLEKLEKMQSDAEELVRQQDFVERQQLVDAFGQVVSEQEDNSSNNSANATEPDRLVL